MRATRVLVLGSAALLLIFCGAALLKYSRITSSEMKLEDGLELEQWLTSLQAPSSVRHLTPDPEIGLSIKELLELQLLHAQYKRYAREIDQAIVLALLNAIGIVVSLLTLYILRDQLVKMREANSATITAMLLQHIGDTRAYLVASGQGSRVRIIDDMLKHVKLYIAEDNKERTKEYLNCIIDKEVGLVAGNSSECKHLEEYHDDK